MYAYQIYKYTQQQKETLRNNKPDENMIRSYLQRICKGIRKIGSVENHRHQAKTIQQEELIQGQVLLRGQIGKG